MQPTRLNHDFLDTNEFPPQSFVSKVAIPEQKRISILETFIPKAIVYFPVIGEIAKIIIYKKLDQLCKEYSSKDLTQRTRVIQIGNYYFNAHRRTNKINCVIIAVASCIAMLVFPMLLINPIIGAIAISSIILFGVLTTVNFRKDTYKFFREFEEQVTNDFKKK
ncbi:hypothetical protein BN1013_01868 [Candidatus Rubidus massiliensis]|nr:hypothetical protein BN1013_01868 [Candidatus Rubidus massiliensis]